MTLLSFGFGFDMAFNALTAGVLILGGLQEFLLIMQLPQRDNSLCVTLTYTLLETISPYITNPASISTQSHLIMKSSLNI